MKSENRIDSVIQAVESGLDGVYGVDRHTFKQKVITTTRVTYRLTNGGWVTIKMKGNRIWKYYSKGCDEETVKNIIKNIKNH